MTSSVTGCSTWMRPFSSRNQKSRPSSMNSAVPGAAVADRARERDRRLAHPRAQLGVERRRGRLLEHLLVAALDRALALAERDRRSRARRRAAGSRRGAAARRSARRRRGRRRRPPCASRRAAAKRLLELARRAHDPHPAAAAARRGLDHEREADLVRLALAARPARRPRARSASPRACRRRPRARRPAARPRRARPPRPPRRTPGSRRGSRSPGGSRRRRPAWPRGCAPRSRGRSRSRPSRRPSARAASRGRPAARPRPSRSRARGRRGRPAARSRRGSLRGAFGSPRRRALLEERAQALLALLARAAAAAIRPLRAERVGRLAHELLRLPAPPRGRPCRSSPTIRSTAASRSAATSWTSPIRSAVAASKRSPVRKYRRAAPGRSSRARTARSPPG